MSHVKEADMGGESRETRKNMWENNHLKMIMVSGASIRNVECDTLSRSYWCWH